MLGSGQQPAVGWAARYGMCRPPLTLPPIKPQIGAISEHDFTLPPSTAKQSTWCNGFFRWARIPLHLLPAAAIDSGDCLNGCLHSTGLHYHFHQATRTRDTAREVLQCTHKLAKWTRGANRCPVISFLSYMHALAHIYASDRELKETILLGSHVRCGAYCVTTR